jgi:hypothetical protein
MSEVKAVRSIKIIIRSVRAITRFPATEKDCPDDGEILHF